MALDPVRTAFIVDSLDELKFYPLVAIDSTISVHQRGAGLTLNIELGDETGSIEYDGSRWLDDEEVATASPAGDNDTSVPGPWMLLLSPGPRTTDVSDDDTVTDQWVEVFTDHAELIELYTTLVTAGWSVAVKHVEPSENSSPALLSVHATAPVFDSECAPAVCAAWQLPSGIAAFETAWTSSARDTEPWSFDIERTRVTTMDGAVHPVDPYVLSLVAIGAAPSWTLQPGVDRQVERHSAGGDMAATVLATPTSEPPPAPSHDEVERRRLAIAEWAEANGFHHKVEPAKTKLVNQALEELGAGSAGYYLLEFDNGDCYLGQSISIADRLKGHQTLRKDIIGIRPNPDPVAGGMANPLRHLLDQESALIDSIQQAGLHARNKAQMTYLTGHRSLDDSFAANDCTSVDWLADPIGINTASFGKGRNVMLAPEKLASGSADLELWKTRTGSDAAAILELISSYMRRCLPLPLQTEYEYWTLSSPAVIPKWRTLSNLTIGWTEAFRINISKDGHLSGWVQANGIELLGEGVSDEAVVRFLRQHPGASLDETSYQAAGPYNLNVRACNLQVLAGLLDDTSVTRAAATAALHLMRHSKAGASRAAHNPVLVAAALGVR